MDSQFQVPDTDGYIATADGRMFRPTEFGLTQVPVRMLGKYLYTHVKLNRKYRTVRYHRILCRAFHGEPASQKLVARHLDDNKLNNVITNLAWGTNKENHSDAVRNGLNVESVVRSGEDHFGAKLTQDQVNQIRLRRSKGERGCDLAKEFSVSTGTVSLIRNNKIWR